MDLLFKYDDEDMSEWIGDLLSALPGVTSYKVWIGRSDFFSVSFEGTSDDELNPPYEPAWLKFVERIERITGAEFLGRGL